jgi:hypothetical protein
MSSFAAALAAATVHNAAAAAAHNAAAAAAAAVPHNTAAAAAAAPAALTAAAAFGASYACQLNEFLRKKEGVDYLHGPGGNVTVSSGKRHSVAGEPYREIEDLEIANAEAEYTAAKNRRYADVCREYLHADGIALNEVCDAFQERIAEHYRSASRTLNAAEKDARAREVAAAPTPCEMVAPKKCYEDACAALNAICRREYEEYVKKFKSADTARTNSVRYTFHEAESRHLGAAKVSESQRSARRKTKVEKERKSAAAKERESAASILLSFPGYSAAEGRELAASMLPDLPSHSEAVSGLAPAKPVAKKRRTPTDETLKMPDAKKRVIPAEETTGASAASAAGVPIAEMVAASAWSPYTALEKREAPMWNPYPVAANPWMSMWNPNPVVGTPRWLPMWNPPQ